MRSENTNHGAVFLDRDGTVSEEIGYMYDVARYRIFPWTGHAIRKMNDTGMRVILATNQSGVERGYFTERMVHRVHDRLRDAIARYGARLDGAYFCPHTTASDCPCRKPRPGMLIRAQREFGIDLSSSYMVGDRISDVRAGKAARTRTILVMTGDGQRERALCQDDEMQPDLFAEDLAEAAELIRKGR